LFELDDPLSNYLPEYKNMEVYLYDSDPYVMIEATEPITIRHLLTHTAGFTYGWDRYNYVDSLYRAIDPPLWESSSLQDFTTRDAENPLKFMPGHVWEYSISLDVAGYLVEVLSGMSFDVFLKARLFEPLKMNDTGFEVPDSAHDRLAMIYQLDYETGKNIPQNYLVDGVKKDVTLFSGGGGMVSSVEDYARFGQMLLNGGELDGARILEQETVDLIMSDQLPKDAKYELGSGYGLGGSVDMATGYYHWSGMASTFFWVCPEDNMVVLCFAQFLPNQKYRFAWEFKEMAERAVL
jgi:CubicO group peptidase (beta-lactamase class C family)